MKSIFTLLIMGLWFCVSCPNAAFLDKSNEKSSSQIKEPPNSPNDNSLKKYIPFKIEQKALPRMQYLGKFSIGAPEAGVYKLYDNTEDIVCYILMPDIQQTQPGEAGITYNGNSLGSISCVKIHYVPPKVQTKPEKRK